MLERERFDVLHFHEPFVPFLSLFLLRESTSVNVATFHAYAGFSPSYEFGSRALQGHARAAARPDRGQRGGAPLHRPLLPGRLQGHPQRRRRRALRRRRPARALAGRHPERPVRRPPRAAQGPARPAQGAPHPAQDRLDASPAHRRLRPAGARGAPLRRDARPAGRRVPGPGQRRREGAAVPDGRRSTPRRRPAASRSASCCSRRWPPGTADRVLRHPRLQGRRPARPRGPARAAARAAAAGRRHRPAAARRRAARADGRRRPGARRGVQLVAGDGQGRRLLRVRHPPRWRPPGSLPRRLPRRDPSGAAAGPGRGVAGPTAVGGSPPAGAGARTARGVAATRRGRAARPRPSRRRPGRSRRWRGQDGQGRAEQRRITSGRRC